MNSKVFMVIRYLVALAMIVFGANKLIPFMPQPDPSTMSEGMQSLMGAWSKSPFLKIIGLLEILGGLALALNKYVPLALTVLCAIMVNAFLVHLFFDTANIAGAAVFLGLVLALIYQNRERFKGILSV
jgi:putative oxidoreductase